MAKRSKLIGSITKDMSKIHFSFAWNNGIDELKALVTTVLDLAEAGGMLAPILDKNLTYKRVRDDGSIRIDGTVGWDDE